MLEGKYIPKTNTEFWVKKIARNIERDKEVNKKLESEGWIILRFWETDIRKNVFECADIVEETLKLLSDKGSRIN